MAKDKESLLRKIPAVDRLLTTPRIEAASKAYPRGLILKSINQILEEYRTMIGTGEMLNESELRLESVSETVVKRLEVMAQPSLRQVINATGIVVHTNFGRSILSKRVLDRFGPLAGGYSNLEYDLDQGERGSRYTHVEGILKELTDAEAATVVNNNAAAVFIALETMARGREVVVSRGQLVEIGGSFRIPDVMRKSGAKMVEVGTTNKTHLRDYEEVINPETALLLKVHRSNFDMVGFTEEVRLHDLANLGKKYGVPVMDDLGSGCLLDLSKYGLKKEPTVQEALAQGADLVTFSGDKLLGGPQAGIILGRRDLVESIQKNPINRAVRIDKLTLLALEETLRLYRDEDAALKEIPTLRMICQTYTTLRKKAARLLRLVGNLEAQGFSIELEDGCSKVGGGALPLLELKSRLLCLVPQTLSSHFMEKWLRSYQPPVITRVDRDKIIFDVRTIPDEELKTVAGAIRRLSQI